MMNELVHVTLTSWHTRRSPRSEVSDAVIEVLKPIIRSGGGELAGLVIRCDPAPYSGGRSWTIGATGTKHGPAVVCWCCWSEETSPAWWRLVLEVSHADAPLLEPPPTPWLAVDLMPTALLMPHFSLQLLGDCERCIAWMLIDDAAAGSVRGGGAR